jgi:hypothetical protein
LSTKAVDKFVDSRREKPLNAFPTKEFLALTKKAATKNPFKYNEVKKTAPTVDSRAASSPNAPILCISPC